MKKKSSVVKLVFCIFVIVNIFCVSNESETSQLEMKAAGTWTGFIIPIKIPPIDFNGAKIFLNISSKDSTFHMVGRDTTEILSLAIRDTILVLDGLWSLNVGQDLIVLQLATCRAVDTSTNTLNDRPVQGQKVPLPMNIAKNGTSIIWEISFADLAPLIPLLGLTIPASQIGLLKNLTIGLEKISQ